jgi:AraC family transcriptional regulator, regulatory protein of adaptative response / methylated-DNA-[protein]-cysteine methyltransferase
MLHINPESAFQHDIPAADYDIIRKVIEHISLDYRGQPSLEDLADETGLEATALQKLFSRWAGLSPKAFLQAVTMDHARRLLDDGLPLLDTAYEVGLSGPSRLHDLFITHEAMSPGDFKTRGGGLTIRYGFHPSPFGLALIMTTERGICGLAFADAESGDAALNDMKRRWPEAVYVRDDAAVAGEAARVFDPSRWRAERPLRIVLIGTDFQVRVWQSLLDVPMGNATTYGTIARKIGSPKASRAVGAAVGANPISFVVPCHRAVGATGALTGYHWGLTRKRAMLGWEAGQVLRA